VTVEENWSSYHSSKVFMESSSAYFLAQEASGNDIMIDSRGGGTNIMVSKFFETKKYHGNIMNNIPFPWRWGVTVTFFLPASQAEGETSARPS